MGKQQELPDKARFRLGEFAHELEDLRDSTLLKLFQEKYRTLDFTIYAEKVDHPNLFETLADSTDPGIDPLRSFLMTLRKFENKQDPGSLPNIGKMYHFGFFTENLTAEWDRMYGEWNRYLDDALPPPKLDFFMGRGKLDPRTQVVCVYPRRYFLYAFLYGLHSHSVEPYRTDARERWPACPSFYHFAQYTFLGLVLDFFKFLCEVEKLNQFADQQLNKLFPEQG